MKRKFLSLFIIVFTFFSFIPSINAASLSISASSKSVVTGNTITITIKASGLAGKFSVTSSNSNILSGGTNSVWVENESKSYKFTAKNIGSATIKVTPIDVADSSGKVYTSSKSVTVNVVKPREKSTNNNLKSLSVDGYSLTPSFNKNTLEYTVNLESNVEKIKINATKEDGYASLSGIGEKEVQEGDNKFEITVTSETGKSKVYTVNAIVKDSNPIVKKIGDKDYTVVKRTSALTGPDNFEPTTVLMNEVEIPAFYNEITNITLIGLKDENGTIHLSKYDQKTDECTKFEILTSNVMTVVFKEPKEAIENYNKTTVTINEKEYSGYQHKDNKDYVLIYGTLLETGEDNWYLYNIKENSIQTYMNDFINNIETGFDKTLEEYKIVLLVMAGISLLLLLIIIIQIILKSKMKKKLLKKIQVMKEKELLLEKREAELKKELETKEETSKENIKKNKTKKQKN